MATKTTRREMSFEQIVEELRDLGRQASDRLTDLFKDDSVRKHLQEMGQAFEEFWTDVVEHVREAAEAKPLDEMTLEELHHLATERELPGRSKMTKAELIEALRKG